MKLSVKSRGMSRSRLLSVLSVCAIALALSGCFGLSPYTWRDNWVIRQNDVPQYFADYDIFYVYAPRTDEAGWLERQPAIEMYDSVKRRVQEPFGKKVRVFCPCLRESEAVEDAVDALAFYLNTYHDPGRSFIVMIEGRDADFRARFRDEASGSLKPKVGCIGIADRDELVVDSDFVMRVGNAVRRRKIRATWNVASEAEVF